MVVAGLLERDAAIAFGDGVAETLLVDDALAPGLEAVERRGVEVCGAVPANRGRRTSAETLDLVLALGLGDDVQRVGFVGGARQLATWAARSRTALPAAGPSTTLPARLSTTGPRIALPQTSHARTLAWLVRSHSHCGPW